MAWEISIGPEAWGELREQLDKLTDDKLIEAMLDDKQEKVRRKAGDEHAKAARAAEAERLKQLSHDDLVDAAYNLMKENNTCDNGGYLYWIDVGGYHRIRLPEDGPLVRDKVQDSNGNKGTITVIFHGECCILWDNGMTGSFRLIDLPRNGITVIHD